MMCAIITKLIAMVKLICQRCVRFRQRGEKGEKGDPGQNGQNGQNGTNGKDGHNGRFFYYAGPYNQNASYVMAETQAPYVSIVLNGVKKFFMLDLQGSEPPQLPFTATLSPTANGQLQWTEMQSPHKYYIAEAIFADSAYLGSLVIKGNWMISQHGKLNGSESQNYGNFNENDPRGESNNHFAPHFCVNMLTGSAFFNDAVIGGTVIAKRFQKETKVLDSNTGSSYTIDLESEPYSFFLVARTLDIHLPSASDYDGIELEFFTEPNTSHYSGSNSYNLKTTGYDIMCRKVQDSTYHTYESVNTIPGNTYMKLKAINGYWYILEGDYEWQS